MATFADLEASKGEPVEAYIFRIGSETYYFTSHDQDYEYNGQTWLAQPIKADSGLTHSDLVEDAELVISMPRNHFFSKIHKSPLRQQVTDLELWRIHKDGNGGFTDPAFLFDGKLITTTSEDSFTRFKFQSLIGYSDIVNLSTNYSPVCQYELFSQDEGNGMFCGVDSSLHRHTANVIAKAGNVLTLDVTFATNLLAGGAVVLASTQNGAEVFESRMIISNTGNQINMINFSAIDVGDNVTLFEGCDRRIQTCDSKFNNSDRYGGYGSFQNQSPKNSYLF